MLLHVSKDNIVDFKVFCDCFSYFTVMLYLLWGASSLTALIATSVSIGFGMPEYLYYLLILHSFLWLIIIVAYFFLVNIIWL